MILQQRLINVNPSVIEVSPTLTIKDDKVRVPKTEKWGGAMLDFSGTGKTIDWTNGKTPLPKPSEMPKPATVPKFNKNWKGLYQG